MRKKILAAGLVSIALATTGLTLGIGGSEAATQSETRITSFNASPEPVAVGDSISIKGHIDHKVSNTWVKLANVPVKVQRKLNGGSYTNYSTPVTNSAGDISVSAPATASASWRLVFAGNSTNLGVTGPGDNVTVGPKTVTAKTKVTNWPDTSVTNSIWANDAFTRTATVTRDALVQNGCGAGIDCFKYVFTVSDVGTFKTASPAGGQSPNVVGVDYHGIIRGSFEGGLKGSFLSTSRVLSGIVPATEDGADGKVRSTGEWGTLALPTSAVYSGATTTDYDWTYVALAPETCETFTQASTGNTGNITGVNACTE